MEHIEFNFIGKFGDKIKFICELKSSYGRITRVSRYDVHMFINNYYKKLMIMFIHIPILTLINKLIYYLITFKILIS